MASSVAPCVLAIDPGRDAGWSLFVEGQLVECGLGNVPDVVALPSWAFILAERPSIHRGTRNPDDIITLAIDLGQRLAPFKAAGMQVDTVLPVQWKGTMPKDVHNARVRRALRSRELEIVDEVFAARRTARAWLVPPSKQHNVIDAIGLGLYAVGRGV